ncbi:glycerate kinase [Baekduia soli]|uniref:glycerate kinase n=1 Tax=Baekduia soli TaxID=496014 RepID=UPI00225E394C|nr:glycerate kinase [Baekduia soli]
MAHRVLGAAAPTILLAPDSFKGTFTAREVAEALAAGVRAAGARPDRCPVADGGEGTMDVLLAALGGTVAHADVHDPLGRPVTARYALLADGRTAVVESAQASGLALVAEADRDAEAASTTGTGELLAAALAAGARRVLVTVGGSATTDGGLGRCGRCGPPAASATPSSSCCATSRRPTRTPPASSGPRREPTRTRCGG